ncbi:hypothetical protein H072_6132 [Dactylellina haptotyla CBS 200.50]|uniref:AT hook domain-containing protein family protein n=1 Tax=Dactylellina haptotyla (strain CBS 200.50) TaxID=1284197 RepID=S8BKY6_DACHA|nr:hypothetical protein H072_6132 [Dactylellina haptotyla CBS 200.50]
MAGDTKPGTRRSTRSLAQKAASIVQETEDLVAVASQATLSHPPISSLPPSSTLTPKFTGLRKWDISLLQQKQRLLKASTPLALASLVDVHLQTPLSATLVFAQKEAGTAFCISPTGLLLTCSHCVSEEHEDLEDNRFKWLIFASGRVVKAKCIAYDPIRDIALLQIVAAETTSPVLTAIPTSQETNWTSFPFISVSSAKPKINAPMICIGHPGDEDLECEEPGKKTGYDVLHMSFGRYRGIAEDADVQDNSDIGALMHDCWTYWGHSGAPLCLRNNGNLVGMHSSWDDETGMRRGVAWDAVVEFLRENQDPHRVGSGCSNANEMNEGSSERPIFFE